VHLARGDVKTCVQYSEKLMGWSELFVPLAQNPMMANAIPTISLGFLPLNHMMGRGSLLKTLMNGGKTYFVRSPDMSTFLDDMRAVRPTEGLFPPRLINMMYDHFNEMLARIPAAKTEEQRQQQRQVSRTHSEHPVHASCGAVHF
jgi:fatty acid CoA ligase FadD9